MSVILTVSSSTTMSFSGASVSRMSFPLTGAQEPFSMNASVRFWMLCSARSWMSSSIVIKIPALYVVAAKTRWL